MPRSINQAPAAAGTPASQPTVVHVPLRFRRRGGRKLVFMASDDDDGCPVQPSYADPALVKALARAFSWQQQIDSGVVADINELAQTEGLSSTYVGRVLRLTLLAPHIVERILEGEDLPGLTAAALKAGVPSLWEMYCDELASPSPRN